MRLLLRLVLAVAVASLVLAGVAIGIPLVGRGLYRHAATTQAATIPPLSAATEGGSTVYASNGSTVLFTLQASVTRKPVALKAVSPILIHAVLDTEDHRFYEHGGIDLPSTLRALLSDSAGNNLQGGSTITQELVKQVYLTSQRTLSRKIKEAFIANRLEKLYTKNQILDTYLNTIYLGSGAYGVEAAAEAYWGETTEQLTLPQAALLAGLIQSPSGYDPISDPTAARTRRTEVLGRMLHYHDITAAEYATANASPLPTTVTTTPAKLSGIDGYYVSQVEDTLLAPGSPLGATQSERDAALFEGGLKIYTNLNVTAQARAEAAVTTETPAAAIADGFEENLVAINPANGDVDALIGGQNYQDQQYDVVTQGHRQAGSGFKIFTLLAGLEHGQSIDDDVDASAPCTVPFPNNLDYTPGHDPGPANNDEGDGQQGVTTILNATAQSLNCAYFRMAHQVGLPAVIAEAEKLGISKSEIGSYSAEPSIVLGTAGVEPIQMAAAYATLASGGTYHTPSFINHVVDRSGATIYAQPTTGKVVVSPNVVAEADAAFQAVVDTGTGTAVQIPGREVAGKTGTTTGPTDAWFNGYTPQLETTVWMGYPPQENKRLIVDGEEVYGGMYPAQTVHDYMAAALAGQPVETFPPVDVAALPAPGLIPEDTLADQGTTLLPPYQFHPIRPPTSTTTTPTTTTTTPSNTTTTPTTAAPPPHPTPPHHAASTP